MINNTGSKILNLDLSLKKGLKLNLIDYISLNLIDNEYIATYNNQVIAKIPHSLIIINFFNGTKLLNSFISELSLNEQNAYKLKISDMPKDELRKYVLKEVNNKIFKEHYDRMLLYPKLNNKNRRATHCYNCKDSIDTDTHITCDKCKGIICHCGACFCNKPST